MQESIHENRFVRKENLQWPACAAQLHDWDSLWGMLLTSMQTWRSLQEIPSLICAIRSDICNYTTCIYMQLYFDWNYWHQSVDVKCKAKNSGTVLNTCAPIHNTIKPPWKSVTSWINWQIKTCTWMVKYISQNMYMYMAIDRGYFDLHVNVKHSLEVKLQ